MSDPFWLNDPSILFAEDKWYNFVPLGSMKISEALNAVVRFSIYLSIILTASKQCINYLLITPAAMMITYALYVLFPNGKVMESFVSSYRGEEKTRPTQDNPFMNPKLTDINDNPNKPPSAIVTDKDVRDEVNQAFAETSNILMDTQDVYGLVQSQRNFYTVPTDDYEGLLKFLGKNASSGKIQSESYIPAKGTAPTFPTPSVDAPPSGTSRSSF
jgi:hypothetical protein